MSAPVLPSALDTSSPDAMARAAHNRALARDLRARVAQAALGGDARSRDRHLAHGKLLPHDRVERLLDPGAPFLEIGLFAAHGLYDDAAPSAGIIAGVGRVSGREVMILCNDATVKGGTYYPASVKKHLRAQEIAEANRLPFGLSAYAFTRSGETATRLGNEVEVGMLSLNHLGLALPEVPFGGIKDSGYGTEGGSEAIEAYLETRFVTRKG